MTVAPANYCILPVRIVTARILTGVGKSCAYVPCPPVEKPSVLTMIGEPASLGSIYTINALMTKKNACGGVLDFINKNKGHGAIFAMAQGCAAGIKSQLIPSRSASRGTRADADRY